MDSKHTNLLGNLLAHDKIADRPDLQLPIAEYLMELEPKSKTALADFIRCCKKMISVSYATRKFDDFEKNLLKLRPYDPIFEQFFRLSSRQFLKADVSVEEWRTLLNEAQKAKSIMVKKTHAGLIVKLIHEENLKEAFSEYQKKLHHTHFSRHDLKLSIALLRLAQKQGEVGQIWLIRQFLRKKNLDRDLRSFAKIKLFEVNAEIKFEKGSAPHGLWHQIMDMLKKIRTTPENKDYIERLERIYLDLEARHVFLPDIRMSNADQMLLRKSIEVAIEYQKPFSLLRLGDADSYGLDTVEFDRKIFDKDCEARERKWWGENLPVEVKNKIHKQFQQTLFESDIVGIPSIFRFISDLPDPWISFRAERNQRGSVVVMDSVHQLSVEQKIPGTAMMTDNRCHYVMFDRASADKFANMAKHVIVVSPHAYEKIQGVFSRPIETIQIPREGSGSNALPYHIDYFAGLLTNKIVTGTVVFVAAGFAGKYFLKVAKDAGAIGLDVGAMADYWVGIKSRGLELV